MSPSTILFVHVKNFSIIEKLQYVLDAVYTLIIVGILWGCTNPFMKIGSQGIQTINHENKFISALLQIRHLCTTWKYILPFLLNQCGSILYCFALQQASLSICVPIANSIAFICTACTSWLLGESPLHYRTMYGIVLVLLGIGFYLTDEIMSSES